MFCTRYRLTRQTNADGRIYGTWDFKWPQGTTIRVAFKDWVGGLNNANLDGIEFTSSDPAETKLVDGAPTRYGRLTRIVECLARRWLMKEANIRFAFDHPDDDQILDADAYDVLVSLAPLPISQSLEVLTPVTPKTPNGTKLIEKKYFLPGSELGRYAQRVDYNVPTTYLGKREHLAGSLAEYFSSPEFQHWVIHEFGHVLGLPHEQQNPNINQRIKLKDKDKLVGLLRTALGYPEEAVQDITAAEVEEEIIQPWPTLPGAPYCDFRSYGQGDPIDDTTSVMFHLFWERLLVGGADDAPARYHQRPTDRDLDNLGVMYPPRLAARAVASARPTGMVPPTPPPPAP